MVEATAQGDGVRRDITYAVWRAGTEQEGYSQELCNVEDAGIKDWAEVENRKTEVKPGVNTLMKAFKDSVRIRGNRDFLGSRRKQADGTMSPYIWQTYAEVDRNSTHLARAMMKLGFCRYLGPQQMGVDHHSAGRYAPQHHQRWLLRCHEHLGCGLHYESNLDRNYFL